MTSDRESKPFRPSKIRSAVATLVVFAAGFATALWLVRPPVSEARGEALEELVGIEYDRKGGLHLEGRGGEWLAVASTWGDGVPRSHPVPPGGGVVIPPDEVGGEWGLYEIRFRPCRFGNCTDPVPPPDLLNQGGLVVFDPDQTRVLLCKNCELNDCCPDPGDR